MDLVEELARAICKAGDGDWGAMDEGWRAGYRRDARAALDRLDSLGLVIVDEGLGRIINMVADEAWTIASDGSADADVCRAIENLSDEPEVRARLIANIRAMLAAATNKPASDMASHCSPADTGSADR